MPASSIVSDPLALSTFGELLRYVRRRARLTQRDLGIAVGYSESHINRFEKNKHLPDPATVAALFVPALCYAVIAGYGLYARRSTVTADAVGGH